MTITSFDNPLTQKLLNLPCKPDIQIDNLIIEQAPHFSQPNTLIGTVEANLHFSGYTINWKMHFRTIREKRVLAKDVHFTHDTWTLSAYDCDYEIPRCVVFTNGTHGGYQAELYASDSEKAKAKDLEAIFKCRFYDWADKIARAVTKISNQHIY